MIEEDAHCGLVEYRRGHAGRLDVALCGKDSKGGGKVGSS